LRPLTLFTVKIVRDNVAALYESSAFAESDLREFSRFVRRAVGLGRSCIDPLAVLSALLNPTRDELLSLQLHPLQASLPKAKRRASMESLLVTAVSQVGVCINECAQKEWLAPMLQFVPGLGARKAVQLLKVQTWFHSCVLLI
jgi:transcription elongation factor SPT6